MSAAGRGFLVGSYARWEASFERQSRLPGTWEPLGRRLSWIEIICRAAIALVVMAMLALAVG